MGCVAWLLAYALANNRCCIAVRKADGLGVIIATSFALGRRQHFEHGGKASLLGADCWRRLDEDSTCNSISDPLDFALSPRPPGGHNDYAVPFEKVVAVPYLEALTREIQEFHAAGTAILCDEAGGLRQFDARPFTPSFLGSFAGLNFSTFLALTGPQSRDYDPCACWSSSMQFFHSSPPSGVCGFALKRV